MKATYLAAFFLLEVRLRAPPRFLVAAFFTDFLTADFFLLTVLRGFAFTADLLAFLLLALAMTFFPSIVNNE